MASNVTFTGADNGSTIVDLDGRLFEAGVEVKNVSDKDLERLRELAGHRFKVDPVASPGDKTNSKS